GIHGDRDRESVAGKGGTGRLVAGVAVGKLLPLVSGKLLFLKLEGLGDRARRFIKETGDAPPSRRLGSRYQRELREIDDASRFGDGGGLACRAVGGISDRRTSREPYGAGGAPESREKQTRAAGGELQGRILP